MAADFEKHPLSDTLGVEIRGLDLSRALDAPTRDRLWTALDEHQLILFRDQDLDARSQVALLESFGPTLLENDNGRSYQFVSNTREDGILGTGRFAFHSDHAFMEEPIDVISLFGLEVPERCGHTHFANALQAARTLPTPLRDRAAGRRARHIIDPEGDAETVVVRGPKLGDALPHAWHPILWVHPRLGEPVLYVSEQQTDSIEGLDDAESGELLEALFAHLYAPELRYVHAWREGDLVIWDNRALQHARDALDPSKSRTLRRVSVGGTSVIDYFRDRAGPLAGTTAEPSPA